MAFVQAELPEATVVRTRPVAGTHLMHNKYIIRDSADLWLGSANFTNDAWQNQENNVLEVHSGALAAHYELDFDGLWKTKNINGTGRNDYGQVEIDGTPVEFGFAPGSGSPVASLFVDAIQGAGSKGEIHLANL